MFDRIQHVGYLVADLDGAVGWFEQGFGAAEAAGSILSSSQAVPGGGRNAFVHFGQIEVELIELEDNSSIPTDTLVMHHVGYVVDDISKSMSQLTAKGFTFAAESPFTNVMGQQVLYLDSSSTKEVFMHLTQLPAQPNDIGVGGGVAVQNIVHCGYLVRHLDEAESWYVNNFQGLRVGGGASRQGGRNAFVNFGQVQVELIQPGDLDRVPGGAHAMDHVGYVVTDMEGAIADCRRRGFRFVADAPITNSIGQRVLYFDTDTTMGTRMHLTQLPD